MLLSFTTGLWGLEPASQDLPRTPLPDTAEVHSLMRSLKVDPGGKADLEATSAALLRRASGDVGPPGSGFVEQQEDDEEEEDDDDDEDDDDRGSLVQQHESDTDEEADDDEGSEEEDEEDDDRDETGGESDDDNDDDEETDDHEENNGEQPVQEQRTKREETMEKTHHARNGNGTSSFAEDDVEENDDPEEDTEDGEDEEENGRPWLIGNSRDHDLDSHSDHEDDTKDLHAVSDSHEDINQDLESSLTEKSMDRVCDTTGKQCRRRRANLCKTKNCAGEKKPYYSKPKATHHCNGCRLVTVGNSKDIRKLEKDVDRGRLAHKTTGHAVKAGSTSRHVSKAGKSMKSSLASADTLLTFDQMEDLSTETLQGLLDENVDSACSILEDFRGCSSAKQKKWRCDKCWDSTGRLKPRKPPNLYNEATGKAGPFIRGPPGPPGPPGAPSSGSSHRRRRRRRAAKKYGRRRRGGRRRSKRKSSSRRRRGKSGGSRRRSRSNRLPRGAIKMPGGYAILPGSPGPAGPPGLPR